MLSIFKQVYEYIFPKKTFQHKIGDVIFAFPNNKSSKKTRAVLKIYGNNGFIVCDIEKGGIYKEKPSLKLLSRQHFVKFNREKKKLDKKLWLGWIPLEEIRWSKRENREI